MWKKLWKIVSEIIEWIVAIVAIIGVVGLLLPRAFHIVPYIVLSGSMEPVIRAGSIVYIDKNIKVEEIQEQDIIGYQMENNIKVVHRVVELDKERGTVITKGDANRVEDLSPVSLEQIEGKLFITIPYIGYGVAWLRTAKGMASIIVLTAVLLAVSVFKCR